MIVKHNVQNLIKTISTQELHFFLLQADAVIEQYVCIENSIKKYQKSEIDGDEILEDLEGYSFFQDDAILLFNTCISSTTESINKYLKRTVKMLSMLKKNIKIIVDSYAEPTNEDCSELLEGLNEVISGLIYVVMHEFAIYDYLENDENIDEVFREFCSSKGLDAMIAATKLYAIAREYRIHLDIFDACPEKEEDFEKMMGPFFIDLNEELLTLDQVDSVINGSLLPEDLCRLLAINQE